MGKNKKVDSMEMIKAIPVIIRDPDKMLSEISGFCREHFPDDVKIYQSKKKNPEGEFFRIVIKGSTIIVERKSIPDDESSRDNVPQAKKKIKTSFKLEDPSIIREEIGIRNTVSYVTLGVKCGIYVMIFQFLDYGKDKKMFELKYQVPVGYSGFTDIFNNYFHMSLGNFKRMGTSGLLTGFVPGSLSRIGHVSNFVGSEHVSESAVELLDHSIYQKRSYIPVYFYHLILSDDGNRTVLMGYHKIDNPDGLAFSGIYIERSSVTNDGVVIVVEFFTPGNTDHEPPPAMTKKFLLKED